MSETPIVPTSGTKRVPDATNPAVVQDAQLVRMSVLGCEGCPHSSTCGVFNIMGGDDWPCIAALDRLEAERDALLDAQQIEPKPTPSARRTTPWLDRSILDAFCAECPSTACELPDDQAKCATLLLIGSIWARGTGVYYALLAEHEAWTAWRTGKPSTSRKDWNRLTNAHDNAERVIRG